MYFFLIDSWEKNFLFFFSKERKDKNEARQTNQWDDKEKLVDE